MLTIYKASAGSGKTFTLTLKYITMLLGVKIPGSNKYRLNHDDPATNTHRLPNRHRRILAITFTNKATDEMKHRIITELHHLADPAAAGKSAYADTLTAEFNCGEDALRVAAAKALNEILLDYGFFNVSTIDSFFQSVLRTFARELDRQSDYEIEIDETSAIAQAITTMLDRFNSRPEDRSSKPVRSWLKAYMSDSANKGLSFNVFNQNSTIIRDLVSFVRQLFDERFKVFGDDLLKWLDNPKNINAFKSALANVSNTLTTQNTTAAQAVKSILDAHRLTLKSPFNGILERECNETQQHSAANFTPKFREAIADPFSLQDLFKKSDAKIVNTISPGETLTIHNFFKAVFDVFCKQAAINAIKENINSIELLNLVVHDLAELKQENNIMLLADTNDLLGKIINGDDLPFIYERIGVFLSHFLIDEFQDTSRMQWNNLKPLVSSSLATDNDNLIIGDVKQAIYRFRNSDSSMLHKTVAEIDFPNNSVTLGNTVKENTNWRSAPEIVRFNNTLFSILPQNHAIDGYDGVVQQISPKTKNKRGYVAFFPIETPKNAKGSGGEGATTTPALPNDSSDADNIALDKMFDEIKRQLHNGYDLSRIAILVNTNAEAKTVVSYLLKHDIPVVSDEGLLLRNAMSVRIILSLMTLIDKANTVSRPTPDGDPVSPTPADIKIMMCRFEFFMQATKNTEKSLMFALDPTKQADISDDESTRALNIDNIISDVISQNPATLPALVEVLIAKRLPPNLQTGETAYIAAFQDLVTTYATHYDNSLKSFLRWWAGIANKATVPAPPESNALSVMTIHKSKGLEFDCVHIPFGSWKLEGRADDIWIEKNNGLQNLGIPDDVLPPAVRVRTSSALMFDKDRSPLYKACEANLRERKTDGMNKTYVAYTRAVCELCVYYNPSAGIGKDLANAFNEGLPPDVTFDNDLMVDLPSHTINNALTFGEPTKVSSQKEQSSPRQNDKDDGHIIINTLEPIFRPTPNRSLQSLMFVDTLGDNDGDIDDTGTTHTESYEDSASQLRGTTLHYVLSMINRDTSAEAFSRAFMIASRRFSLNDEQVATYRQDLERAFADTANATNIARWFTEPEFVRNECVIYIPPKNPLDAFDEGSTRRPDRVMFYDDNQIIEIVDYKFTGETSQEHREQVRQYVELISASYPQATVKGYLWYIDLGIIDEV